MRDASTKLSASFIRQIVDLLSKQRIMRPSSTPQAARVAKEGA